MAGEENTVERISFKDRWPILIYGFIGGSITPVLGIVAKYQRNDSLGSVLGVFIGIFMYGALGAIFTFLKGETKVWPSVLFGASVPSLLTSMVMNFSSPATLKAGINNTTTTMKAEPSPSASEQAKPVIELSTSLSDVTVKVIWADGKQTNYTITDTLVRIDAGSVERIEVQGPRLREKKIEIGGKAFRKMRLTIESSTSAAIAETIGVQLPAFKVEDVSIEN